MLNASSKPYCFPRRDTENAHVGGPQFGRISGYQVRLWNLLLILIMGVEDPRTKLIVSPFILFTFASSKLSRTYCAWLM